MRILMWPEAKTPPHLRSQVLALQDSAWPPDEAMRPNEQRLRHDPALRPVTMVLVESDVVVAALDILTKQLAHAGYVWRAGGLSTVVTRADMRGRGHGLRLVRAARDEVNNHDVDLALFTCDVALRGFYERAGFMTLPGTVVVGGTPHAPFASDQPGFDKVALAAFYSETAKTHVSAFIHSRIELYSGEIDKLW